MIWKIDLMPLASGRYRPHPTRGGRASPMLQLRENLIRFSGLSDEKRHGEKSGGTTSRRKKLKLKKTKKTRRKGQKTSRGIFFKREEEEKSSRRKFFEN